MPPFKLPLFTGDEDHRGIYNAERPVAVSMTYGPDGADYIVRAVNAHDALVAALQGMLHFYEATADGTSELGNRARAALALADGR